MATNNQRKYKRIHSEQLGQVARPEASILERSVQNGIGNAIMDELESHGFDRRMGVFYSKSPDHLENAAKSAKG